MLVWYHSGCTLCRALLAYLIPSGCGMLLLTSHSWSLAAEDSIVSMSGFVPHFLAHVSWTRKITAAYLSDSESFTLLFYFALFLCVRKLVATVSKFGKIWTHLLHDLSESREKTSSLRGIQVFSYSQSYSWRTFWCLPKDVGMAHRELLFEILHLC